MSVSLLISQDSSTDKTRIVPVATESMFSEFWQPAASHLNLQFVPLFQTGLPVGKDDLATVVEELRRLRLYFIEQARPKQETDIFKHIVSRIDNLIRELQQAINQPRSEIYIG